MDTEILYTLRGRKKTAWEQLLQKTGLVPEEMPEQTVLCGRATSLLPPAAARAIF